MTKWRAAGRVVAVGLLVAASVAAAQDLQRGLRNYQDIMAGRKRVEQLSPQERNEVVQVYRILQSGRTESGKSPECQTATTQARNAASELADQAGRLKRCAEAGNLGDDCSSEFSRTRSAEDDYESAVSEVGSYCN